MISAREIRQPMFRGTLETFMEFYEEPHHHEETIFVDLQGSWENLRATIADNHPFPESESLCYYSEYSEHEPDAGGSNRGDRRRTAHLE